MKFSIDYGEKNKIKTIRLDVYENNSSAIKMYEKVGFRYIGNVDLGLAEYGLNSFRLYEKLI